MRTVPTVDYYKNGTRIKPLRNRSVTVNTREERPEDVYLEFVRADLSHDEITRPRSSTTVVRGKLAVTSLFLSKESAKALLYCLHDYFTRVLPNKEADEANTTADYTQDFKPSIID